MKKYTITVATLSTTLVGCGDPIVGTWDGKSINSNESSDSYALPYEICEYESQDCYSIDFSMVVADDKTATLDMSIYNEDYSISMEVTKQDNGYKISGTVDEVTLSLDCTMSDASNLNCVFPDFNVDFVK